MIIDTDSIVKLGDVFICNSNKRIRYNSPLDKYGENRLWRVVKIVYMANNPCDIMLELSDFYTLNENWTISISEIGKYIFKVCE